MVDFKPSTQYTVLHSIYLYLHDHNVKEGIWNSKDQRTAANLSDVDWIDCASYLVLAIHRSSATMTEVAESNTTKDETTTTTTSTSVISDIVDVTVHPLVLLSAADHYHRVARGTKKRVVGVLLGSVSRGQIDATNSFAVPFEEDSSNPVSVVLFREYVIV